MCAVRSCDSIPSVSPAPSVFRGRLCFRTLPYDDEVGSALDLADGSPTRLINSIYLRPQSPIFAQGSYTFAMRIFHPPGTDSESHLVPLTPPNSPEATDSARNLDFQPATLVVSVPDSNLENAGTPTTTSHDSNTQAFHVHSSRSATELAVSRVEFLGQDDKYVRK